MATVPTASVSRLALFEVGDGPVLSAVGLPSGAFATGHYSGAIRVWGVTDGQRWFLAATLEGHIAPVWEVTGSTTGGVVSASMDGSVRLWRALAGAAGSFEGDSPARRACVLVCAGHTKGVLSAAQSLVDATVVSGSLDHTVKVWNGSTGKCAATLDAHDGPVTGVRVLSNGNVVSGSADGTVRVWEPATWRCVRVHPLDGPVQCVAQLRGGGYAAGGKPWQGETGYVFTAGRDGSSQIEAVPGYVYAITQSASWWTAACLSTGCGILADDHRLLPCSSPVAACLAPTRLAVVAGGMCNMLSVYRVRTALVSQLASNPCVQSSRLSVVRIMLAAWALQRGTPPPRAPGRAAALARTLALRRFCRPRGLSSADRPLEIVEPFARDVVGFI